MHNQILLMIDGVLIRAIKIARPLVGAEAEYLANPTEDVRSTSLRLFRCFCVRISVAPVCRFIIVILLIARVRTCAARPYGLVFATRPYGLVVATRPYLC